MTARRSSGAKAGAKLPENAPLALRPSALSLFWLFGCGTPNENTGRTTIVTIEGPLEQRASWWDGYDSIVQRFKEALAEESTSSVLLKIDSPGGDCAGLFEAVRMMRGMKDSRSKRVLAYADESAYSAAYALACVADEIYLPRSGGVGSVGVIAACFDRVGANKMHGINVAVIHAGDRKSDCHPDVPLSSEAIAGVQEDVDALAGMFHELVSSSRGISADAVAALEAGCFMGEDALAAGLADGVMGLDEVLAMLAEDAIGLATKTEEDTMTGKKKPEGRQLASSVEALDLLAKPQVGTPSAEDIRAAAQASGIALESESAEDEGCDDDEDDDEEAAEEDAESSEDESAEDDEEDDDEEAPPSSKDASRASPAKASTSGDVLRVVRALTGATSPGEQIGALHALRDRAAAAKRSEARAEKASAKSKRVALEATVDKAIRLGKLPPAQRKWALSAGLDVVRGYLANAAPVAPRTPLRQKPAKGLDGSTASGEGVIPEAIANVSRAMGMDPAVVAKHADELRAKGLIH